MANTHTDKNIPRDNADMSNEKNKQEHTIKIYFYCMFFSALSLRTHVAYFKFTASKLNRKSK